MSDEQHRFNLIIPSTTRSSKLIFPSSFPTKSCTHFSSPHTFYVPGPSLSSRFAHPNNVWWAAQIMKLLLQQFPSVPCYLVPLRPKYLPQYPTLQHPHTLQFRPDSCTSLHHCSLNNTATCLLCLSVYQYIMTYKSLALATKTFHYFSSVMTLSTTGRPQKHSVGSEHLSSSSDSLPTSALLLTHRG